MFIILLVLRRRLLVCSLCFTLGCLSCLDPHVHVHRPHHSVTGSPICHALRRQTRTCLSSARPCEVSLSLASTRPATESRPTTASTSTNRECYHINPPDLTPFPLQAIPIRTTGAHLLEFSRKHTFFSTSCKPITQSPFWASSRFAPRSSDLAAYLARSSPYERFTPIHSIPGLSGRSATGDSPCRDSC